MTFKQLKLSVEDRVSMLKYATAQTGTGEVALAERRDEAQVILDLINRVDA